MPISMHTFNEACYFGRQSLCAWKKSKRIILALLVEFHSNSSCGSLHGSGNKTHMDLEKSIFWHTILLIKDLKGAKHLSIMLVEDAFTGSLFGVLNCGGLISQINVSVSSKVYHVFHLKCWVALSTFVPVFQLVTLLKYFFLSCYQSILLFIWVNQ